MLMLAPTAGDTFTGNSGVTYTAAGPIALNIGDGDVRQALLRNWAPEPAVDPILGKSFVPYPGLGNFSLTADSQNYYIALPTENLLTFSQTLQNAVWSSSNLTSVTDNATTDPLGTSTASALVVNLASAFFQVAAVAVAAAQKYTLSVWVKGVGTSLTQTVTLGNFNNGTRQYASIKLTAGWQLISLPFIPAGTVNNNFYLQLNGSPTNAYGTVPVAGTVYVWGWQLNKGSYKKAYVATTASTVVDSTNYQVLGVNATSAANPIIDFMEESSGVFVGAPRATHLQGTDSSFLLIKNASRRVASIVIAAADSVNPYASDYICSGSADQTAISNAISSLRGNGGKVVLRTGTYILNATITHDADFVTLEGESRGFWGGYNFGGPYPVISIEGWSGGVKLKQMTSGAAGITVGTNFQGNTRHQGIGIKKLYLFGYQLTGTGITDANATDVAEITDCVIHNFSKGIVVGWDTPLISGCSIQSIASDAITHNNSVYGTIVKNIFYDIGGSGVVVSSDGGQIIGNTMGHLGGPGVLCTGKSVTINGNAIQGVTSGSCIDLSGATAINCTVSGNTLSLNRNLSGTLETNSNTTGHGIYLHTSAVNNAITGNNINNTNASASGYAVCLGQAGDTTITGCTVVGNVITGSKWNAASATTILDSSGGTTNKVGMNAGDSKAVGTQ